MLRRSMNLVVNAIVFCSETKEDIFGGDRVRKDKEYTPDSQSHYGPPFSMFFFFNFSQEHPVYTHIRSHDAHFLYFFLRPKLKLGVVPAICLVIQPRRSVRQNSQG